MSISSSLSRSSAESALVLLGWQEFDDASLRELASSVKQLFLVDRLEGRAFSPAEFPHVKMFSIPLATLMHQRLIATNIAWQAVLQSLEIRARPGWESFKQQIEECHHAAHLLLSDVADFGVAAFRNARLNWQGEAFLDWSALKNCAAGIPAIVCGAGPSLEEARPFLERFQSKALLIAAGKAIELLGRYGIEAHLACALDKETPREFFLAQPFSELPVCLQSRLNPECVSLIHGAKILAPEGGPLPWERWWWEKQEEVSFGWTVGNFATQIALWMGCNPIIWTGMDYCYRQGQKYAEESANHARHTQRDFLMAAAFQQELGQRVTSVRFIDTMSSRSPPFPEPIEAIPWSQIRLERQLDLPGCLHAALQQGKNVVFSREKEREWEESIQRTPQEGEPVYDYYLEPLWRIYRPLFAQAAVGQDLELHRTLFFQKVIQHLEQSI